MIALVLAIAGLGVGSHRSASAHQDSAGVCNDGFQRPDGTLVANGGTGAQYVVYGCTKRWVESVLAYNSQFFDTALGAAQVGSSQELDLLTNGSNIRVREGTVLWNSSTGVKYVVDITSAGVYQKRQIISSGWSKYFGPCNYPVTAASSSELSSYATGGSVTSSSARPDGMIVIYTGQPAQYLVEDGKIRWIQNLAVLSSYNFQQSACTVVAGESFQFGWDLRAREGTLVQSPVGLTFAIDYVGSGVYNKRHIAGPTAWGYYGWSGGQVRSWTTSDINSYSEGVHVHPLKYNFSDVWDHSLYSGDLYLKRTYEDSALETTWASVITSARTSWNGSPLSGGSVFFETGVNIDVQVSTLGQTDYLGQANVTGRNGSGQVTSMVVILNSDVIDESLRQAVTVHELGHTLQLAHDGLNPDDSDPDLWDEYDGLCGPPRVPRTVMDYDCLASASNPEPWDACGFNHKFPNPSWQANSSTQWPGC